MGLYYTRGKNLVDDKVDRKKNNKEKKKPFFSVYRSANMLYFRCMSVRVMKFFFSIVSDIRNAREPTRLQP